MKTLKRLTLLLLILSLSSICFASEITVTVPNGITVDLWIGEEGWDHLRLNGTVGEFDVVLDGKSSVAYCVELGISHGNGTVDLTDVNNYTVDYDLDKTIGPSIKGTGVAAVGANGLQAAWLMDQFSTGLGFAPATLSLGTVNYSPDVYWSSSDWNLSNPEDFPIDLSTIAPEIADAALQLAIWEVLYDRGAYADDEFKFGNEVYKQDVVVNGITITEKSHDYNGAAGNKELMAWALSEYYLGELKKAIDAGLGLPFSNDYEFSIAKITTGSDDNNDKVYYQNLLVARAVPEPTTIVLFGFGLLGMGAIGRRKS